MVKKLRGLDVDVHTLLKSDSDDENYSESQLGPSPRKSRKQAGGKKKSAKKNRPKKRQGSWDGDSEEEDISEVSPDEGLVSDSEEEVEMGPRGRPVRSAVKKDVTYRDSSGEEEEEIESSGDEDNEELPRKSQRRTVKGAATPGSRMVSLKVGADTLRKFKDRTRVIDETPTQPPRRSTRAASAGAHQQPPPRMTIGGKGAAKSAGKLPSKTRGRGASVEPFGTRRSSRHHPSDEPMAALSNSGKHVVLTNLQHPSEIKEESEGVSGMSGEHESVVHEEPDAPADISSHEPIDLEVRDSQKEHIELETDEVQEEDREAGEIAIGAATMSRDDTGHEADEDDDMPTRRTRAKTSTRLPSSSPKVTRSTAEPSSTEKPKEPDTTTSRRQLRRRGQNRGSKATGSDEDEYQEDDDGASSDDSASSADRRSPSKQKEAFVVDDDSDDNARSTRAKGKAGTGSKRRHSTSDEAGTQAELAEELEDLRPESKRPRRTARRNLGLSGNESVAENRLRRRAPNIDYRVYRPELANTVDVDLGGTSTPSKRKTGSVLAPAKSLFDTNGPFGGSDIIPFFARPGGAAMDIDSDSSDDDAIRRRAPGAGFGGAVGMTPSAAHPPGMLPPVAQTHNADPMQAGAPANMGKITKPGKNAMADADPLGVPPDISFDSVGGLDDRIQQLKEMVMLPLMYPEMFKAKGVTPPRGVLFHGPPGTGKTLMARAVASSFTGADGKKVTFFMRKGADCLSKWVGEAERQLRLLFDEARNSQPSIIFFDEIDGLAPVRSSKQEQIHASIVSTLLALMDGMDGRGQVVVIGATNRPDAVDPALRRPGRFDREFYFPLPATEARRKIIDIHTKGWEPPLTDAFKDQLAVQTKGYGGADLRALCTEAALNAMQRTYPQIYKSDNKLKVDPSLVTVTARDFMVSIKKMVPSSERSSSSGAAPLPDQIQPLLQVQLDGIKECLKTILPEIKRLTPLEEAEYEDDGDPDEGFEREMMMENFETARVYRPRLLIHGTAGLGQQYLGAAVLHYLEKVHVQSFDLATLMSDATRSPETAVVQLFTEVKRHKPSVIYIPNVDVWFNTLPETTIATFRGLLQTLTSNERVLLFGIAESPIEELDPALTGGLFGFSKRDRVELQRPDEYARRMYFAKVMEHLQKSPRDFPQEVANRKKRKLPELEAVAPPPPREQTAEEKRAQALRDRQLHNYLKLRLNALMENLKQKYRRFKKPAIDHEIIMAILTPPQPPADPDIVVSDIPQPPPIHHRWRPYQDPEDGTLRVEDTITRKVFYNMDLDIIEDRFSNGYYCTPRQFLQDLERIRHDAKIIGDKENKRKANEMLTNSEVYIADVEMDTAFVAQCEEMYARQQKREQERREEAEKRRKEKEAEAARSQSNGHSENVPIPILGTPEPRPSTSTQSNGISAGPPAPTEPSFSSHYQTPQPHPALPLTTTPGWTQLTSHGSDMIGTAHVTPMSMSVIVNDASPTTSGGKRTSDGTGTSQPFSNGHPPDRHSIDNVPWSKFGDRGDSRLLIDNPSWGKFGEPSKGDSQLPATQVFHSSSEAPSSQPYPHSTHSTQTQPHSAPTQLHIFTLPPPPLPDLVCSATTMRKTHECLAKTTTGFSVEQLEQVNAAAMDVVWKGRAEWNRDKVAEKVCRAVDDVVAEVRELQKVLQESASFEC